MTRWRGLLAGAVLAALALPASADMTPPPAEDPFAVTDRDGNGEIDAAEFRIRSIETFFLLDRDGDGHIVITEITEITGVVRSAYAAADADGDGRLDQVEFLAYEVKRFRLADRDGSKTLNRGEVDAEDNRRN
jgi:Ca2+-binding EF-hand superfamily protein